MSIDGEQERPDRPGLEHLVAELCRPVVDVGRAQGLDGMAVSRALERRPAGVLFASSVLARELDEMQENLGEGPGRTALLLRSPVLIPDLAHDAAAASWEHFRREAASLGVSSLFAFPVQIGAVALGLMTMHARQPMQLQGATLRALVRSADSLAGAFLAPVPEDGVRIDTDGELLDSGRIVTHQAVGMVSAQLECGLEDAMVALRARAYAEGVGVATVARDVVDRRIRFAPGVGNGTPKGDDGSAKDGEGDE